MTIALIVTTVLLLVQMWINIQLTNRLLNQARIPQLTATELSPDSKKEEKPVRNPKRILYSQPVTD